jgi:hypothetical protein
MNLPRIGRVVPAVIAVVLVALLTTGVALSAAPAGNPLDQVLAKLDAIMAVLTPTPPEPLGQVKLATVSTIVPINQQAFCMVANVTDPPAVDVDVDIRVVDELGVQTAFSVSVQPGRTGFLFSPVTNRILRCEFIVAGSSVSAIRASIVVRNESDSVVTANIEAR